MRVIGIDLGTRGAIAWADRDQGPVASRANLWDLRKLPPGGRYLAFRKELQRVLGMLEGSDVEVFYERVLRHAGTGAAHVYGGFLGALETHCWRREIRCTGIVWSQVKKRATGKGNADKAMMIQAASMHFGPVCNDDMADALWVLQCGLDQLEQERGQ